ncbi:MAG: type I methionyl aminopeptidase [Clostridiales bacterium]|nr:type I methionyl aminopeptidase [Clostridiales bacterium]
MIQIKSEADFAKMREAGKVVEKTLLTLEKHVEAGITTLELDEIAKKVFDECGAVSSSYHYGDPPFPGQICISPNEVIVHGIPRKDIVLKEGDIVTCDVCCSLNGFHADAARTFAVGKISEEAAQLIRVTEECFWKGFEKVSDQARIGDISSAVQAHAESFGYGVIRELTGHGIGEQLHEDPDVPNYGKFGHGPRIVKGMAFCIEPMISSGKRDIAVLSDEWTIITRDRSLAAHYENTIIMTEKGPEIITRTEEKNV